MPVSSSANASQTEYTLEYTSGGTDNEQDLDDELGATDQALQGKRSQLQSIGLTENYAKLMCVRLFRRAKSR